MVDPFFFFRGLGHKKVVLSGCDCLAILIAPSLWDYVSRPALLLGLFCP